MMAQNVNVVKIHAHISAVTAYFQFDIQTYFHFKSSNFNV